MKYLKIRFSCYSIFRNPINVTGKEMRLKCLKIAFFKLQIGMRIQKKDDGNKAKKSGSEYVC